MTKLYIPVLAGTTREQRKSIYAARLVAEVGATFEEVETELIDPKDFYFPGDGNDPEGKDARYTAVTKRAEGFFIVTPEYNHSIPGTLKRMLDSELEHYLHKPVAFAGASSGQWGGVRAIEALVTAVREMGMVATFTDMHFPKVQDLFDDEGNLLNEAYREFVKGAWVELIWMTKTMKLGRETIHNSHQS
ncbi:MAG: NADPH-dependent oxidoreductase [Candidatus Microsaccharimonas sossegonensis]|uniref:NADPH-dependent oxidoreductase n=1 Tax=Candidatus Microsaccharimonas sossegonensis TaxID=2506948 RepID=A0A4Q0AJ18_9BACT|nr:MAG: NADPH-dependent oxidoreductase [Candidatus Microsaccharimonas sossegonensis]